MASSVSEPGPSTPARRPVIGLTTYSEHAQMMFWNARFAMLHQVYVEAVERAGGIAMLLPPQAGGRTSAGEVVRRLDGLVLSGGADVDPARYGRAADVRSGAPRADRDEWELALLEAGQDQDIPLLCVCRGMQLLNVARGGTLHQHVPDIVSSSEHQPELGSFGTVPVTLAEGSRVASMLGSDIKVACHHHQSLDDIGAGLVVTGRAADGTVEAVESPEHEFLVAVQWHPEQQGSDAPLFEGLIDAAGRRRPDREVDVA